MPPGRHPGEVFRAHPSGRRPQGRPRSHVHWLEELDKMIWERLVCASLLRLLHPRPDPGSVAENGWMHYVVSICIGLLVIFSPKDIGHDKFLKYLLFNWILDWALNIDIFFLFIIWGHFSYRSPNMYKRISLKQMLSVFNQLWSQQHMDSKKKPPMLCYVMYVICNLKHSNSIRNLHIFGGFLKVHILITRLKKLTSDVPSYFSC